MDLSKLRLMNAAGWCKSLEAVRKLANTPVSEITVGSVTLEQRDGNSGSTFWRSADDSYALNSLGLPNPGLPCNQSTVAEMAKIARSADKSLRISIAGFSPSDYFQLAGAVGWAMSGVGTIEANLGCPNVWGSEGQKPIASFNPRLAAAIINSMAEAVQDLGNDRPRIAIKLSPYSDPMQMDEMIGVILQERLFIDEVVTCNTFPNAFAWNEDVPAITPGGGLAGMSGKAMKAIALGQAIRLRSALAHNGIDVVGVGGISTGADVLDFLRAGIHSLQIGTHYFIHGEKVFSELLAECT